jgi:hypothetical protein
MVTVGLGLRRAAVVVLLYWANARHAAHRSAGQVRST